jgi:hypothetical protein
VAIVVVRRRPVDAVAGGGGDGLVDAHRDRVVRRLRECTMQSKEVGCWEDADASGGPVAAAAAESTQTDNRGQACEACEAYAEA